MKKVAYFFSSFLPLLIAMGAQMLAMAFMFGISGLFLFTTHKGGKDTLEDTLMEMFTNQDFSTCIMIVYTLITIAVLGIWYYSRCGGDYLPKPSRTFNVMGLIGVATLVPGMQFFSGYLTSIIALIVPKWWEQYQKLMETAGLDNNVGPLMICYAVILGPICEELIFRGVTMSLAKQALPFWLANFMQAVLFGLFHMNWIQGIYAFVLGLVLGFLCEKGGSIYYSLLFHILFNFWGTILSQLLGNIKESALLGILMFVSMIISLAAGSCLFIFGMMKKERKFRVTAENY